MTMTATGRAFSERDKGRYVRLIAKGVDKVAAAEKIGFAYSTVKRHLKDDESFASMVEDARDEVTDRVEAKLQTLALEKENLGAITYWLENTRPDRWRNTKTIKTELSGPGGGPIQLVQATTIALREVLSDPSTRAAAIGMVRSIEVASRPALPVGQDGVTAALLGGVGSSRRSVDDGAEAPRLSE